VQNRRQQPRQLTLRTGKILAAGCASQIDCAIFDISDGGACLLLPKGAQVADDFQLTIDPGEASYICRVAWRAGHRIGVSMRKTSDR
jgi:hypothetical protein